jgi:predicted deacetylase
MFSSRYLVRFDDICATMNWRIWAEIESCLRAYDVRPIVAIVPRNRDSKLVSDIARRDFWERAREWQAAGWSIGLHGYEHRMVTTEGGIVGINVKSEFAGVEIETQQDRLQRAIAIFAEEGVKPTVWVAPWHSFDANTLTVLAELGITCVSDGFGLFPWRDESGMLWVPQQQWRFRRMPLGVWTVCNHHNHWSRDQLDKFLTDIAAFADRITSLAEVQKRFYGPRGTIDNLVGTSFHSMLRVRQSFNQTSNTQGEANRYLE